MEQGTWSFKKHFPEYSALSMIELHTLRCKLVKLHPEIKQSSIFKLQEQRHSDYEKRKTKMRYAVHRYDKDQKIMARFKKEYETYCTKLEEDYFGVPYPFWEENKNENKKII